MPTFRISDRVVLIHRGRIGLDIGDAGIVTAVVQTDPDRYGVMWDKEGLTGPRRVHSARALVLESEYLTEPAPAVTKETGEYNKKLSLLGLDFTQAQSGLTGLVNFSDTLRDINETSLRLKALQKSVKHVVLYRGPEMNLYLSIHGKDVHLVKHTEGGATEDMTLPLSIVARLIDSFRNGQ